MQSLQDLLKVRTIFLQKKKLIYHSINTGTVFVCV